MKRLLAALLCLALLTGMTACGGGQESSSPAASPAGSSADESSAQESQASPAEGGESPSELPAPPASPLKYSMASGSVGGNFYLMGGGIADLLNKHTGEYFLITSETTGGSTANIGMMQNGEAELGIVMTSALAEGLKGEAEWTEGVSHDKLRGMVPLYPSWMTLYTLESSGIQSMQDLNGKRVGVGSKGAAMDSIFRKFFEDQGITPSQIHNDGHSATAQALGNGTIDAALIFSYPPFASIAELESTNDLAFVGMTEEELKSLTDQYDFYVASALPAGSYAGVTQDVPVVSEWNMCATSADVPEELVYVMTKTLLENQDDLIAVHQSAQYMTPENCLYFNIPLHAGTVRYLVEIGIDVPDHLIPPEYNG